MSVREQVKLENLRVMEYLKEKERQEEERIAELEAAKAEKEKEIARLRAQQERAKDKQTEKVQHSYYNTYLTSRDKLS